ncbi:MAG TPA: hypothetical protein VLB50_10955 [Ignavibacteriaceae bacterium]|nr:hypothetical protein [Ignavibacteriaceae bacterium]
MNAEIMKHIGTERLGDWETWRLRNQSPQSAGRQSTNRSMGGLTFYIEWVEMNAEIMKHIGTERPGDGRLGDEGTEKFGNLRTKKYSTLPSSFCIIL